MKKKYIYIFLFCLFVLFLFLVYQGTTYFIVISKYFKDGENYLKIWREACVAYGNPCEEVQGGISLTINYFNSLKGNLAYFIDHGTMAFGYLIPLISVFSGINFRKYLDTMFSFNVYRHKDYLSFAFIEMNKESFKCAISVYLAYLIFFLFILFVIQPKVSSDLTKYFLSDILGKNFYLNHQKWYYLIEGSIRFFFVPYVYAFLGTIFAYGFKKKTDIIIEPLILYYGISFIMQYLILWNKNFIYLDPIAIMANSALGGYNSCYLMGFTVFIYIISILFLVWKCKKCDVYEK